MGVLEVLAVSLVAGAFGGVLLLVSCKILGRQEQRRR